MPAKPTARSSAKGKGAGLGKKVGPLPKWAWWGVGLGAAVLLGLWLRHRAANAAQQGASTNAATTPTDTSGTVMPGGVGAGNAPATDLSPLQSQLSDISSQLNGLAGILSAVPAGGSPAGGSPFDVTQPASVDTFGTPVGTSGGPTNPFRQLLGTIILRSGSVVRTYASGEVTEQAPGRTPYTIAHVTPGSIWSPSVASVQQAGVTSRPNTAAGRTGGAKPFPAQLVPAISHAATAVSSTISKPARKPVVKPSSSIVRRFRI